MEKYGNMETWKYGKMETWKYGNMKHGKVEIWKHGNMKAAFQGEAEHMTSSLCIRYEYFH